MREMKDSGIEWIGELPIGWETRKIKYIATLNGRIGWQGLTSSEYCDDGAYLITGINFDNGKIDWSTCVHVPMERWAEAPQIQIQNEDLLITKDGTVGKVAIVSNMPSETSLNSGVLLIRTVDSCYKKYLFWILQSEIFWKWFNTINAGNSTIIHLYQYDFCNFSFPFPEYSLQYNIANYLDRKCSQIDAIIARQQEVIEKLKAYKLSIITEAVTKGLNPDVPMKDSGVEWIGEIPEHWKMVRLKFLLSHIIDCPHETPIYSADGDYLVIRTADQDLGKLRADEDMYCLDEGEYQNRIRRMPLEKDDIVYGREGERWGLACLVPESNKYCLGQRMLQFRCKKELFLPKFAMWALNSKFVYLQGAVDTIGSTSPHVNISTVRNFLIPVPKINEQHEIVEYVNKKMLQLDKEVEHRENLICKLNEYKKSLIYEVVTGKKEISNMNEKELESFIFSLYKRYLDNENIVISLPINDIIFTDNVAERVLELQPELANHEGFNKNELSNCCGYTCLFADNTATIIISRDGIEKNVLWIGTLIHEVTHVRDYRDYLYIINAENFQGMLKNEPFWYWTEFHAKFKGCTYMLEYAKKLPLQYFQPYIDDLEKRIHEFPSNINKRDDPHFKVYDTMHLMGEMLAFENQSVVLSQNVCDEIYETCDWFVDMKDFLSKHIDKITNEEMCLLSFNARRIFFDSLWG